MSSDCTNCSRGTAASRCVPPSRKAIDAQFFGAEYVAHAPAPRTAARCGRNGSSRCEPHRRSTSIACSSACTWPTPGASGAISIERAETEHWSFHDFLAVLVAEEVAHRQQTRLGRLSRRAEFPFLKTIDDFDFTFQSTLRLALLGSALCARLRHRGSLPDPASASPAAARRTWPSPSPTAPSRTASTPCSSPPPSSSTNSRRAFRNGQLGQQRSPATPTRTSWSSTRSATSPTAPTPPTCSSTSSTTATSAGAR